MSGAEPNSVFVAAKPCPLTSVTNANNHVPCECLQFDNSNLKNKKLGGLHFAASFQKYNLFFG